MKADHLSEYVEPKVETITDDQILEELGEAQATIQYGGDFLTHR